MVGVAKGEGRKQGLTLTDGRMSGWGESAALHPDRRDPRRGPPLLPSLGTGASSAKARVGRS